jgi:hypothetical protein
VDEFGSEGKVAREKSKNVSKMWVESVHDTPSVVQDMFSR